MAIDCVLLAAGDSTRMGGGPKLLLSLGGRTIFERALEAYAASSVGAVCAVVPGWIEGFARIAAERAGERVAFVPRQRGPMSESLKSGWAWVMSRGHPEAVLIGLADKPLVRTETIDLVLGSYRAGGRKICVPTYRGAWGHPVVLESSLEDEVMRLEGDSGARELLLAHRDEVLEVPVAGDEVTFDVDTAEDVERLRARLRLNG
ncbi:MAG: nucleotidyltransferase family protein [bacterium]